MRNLSRLFIISLAGTALTLGACSSTQTRDHRATDAYAVIDAQHAPVPQIQMGDAKTIHAIIQEGKNNSQIMATLTELCDTFGPRLTGSAALEKSQRWARARFESFGADNAHLQKWGEIETRFDRGPSTARVLVNNSRKRDAQPTQLRTLEFTTLSWSSGTDGPAAGPVMFMPTTLDEYEQHKGQYKDAWVLIQPNYSGRGGIRSTGYQMRERMDERAAARKEAESNRNAQPTIQAQAPDPHTWEGTFGYHGSPVPATLTLDESGDTPVGTMSIKGFSEGPISDIKREGDTVTFHWKHEMGTSDIELTFDGDNAKGVSRAASGNEFPLDFHRMTGAVVAAEQSQLASEHELLAAVLEENPSGFVSSSKDERVWTTSANDWRTRKQSDYPKDVEINVRQSDYDFLAARASEGLDFTLEVDARNDIKAGPFPVYNVIAEITGTEKPDEVIIISGHMDSWDGPGSVGAIDNGTGTCVAIEAARILTAVGAKPKRTIRFALWSGEEQGLLGSKGYVQSLSEQDLTKISAVFVDDGGTGYEAGIPAADFMVGYLAAATAPTNGEFYSDTDDKYLDVNIRPTGAKINTHSGSDHASFNRVGVPGFFWDEGGRADYSYGWHTQNDRLDLAIEEYLIQSATNAAIVAYNLANAPDLLPREGEVFARDPQKPVPDDDGQGYAHDHDHDHEH